MQKVNIRGIAEETWSSPKGKFAIAFKGISLALGRKEESTDVKERHPFDLELNRVPPGKVAWPYHLHSAQWEFYHVIAGKGVVRDENGQTEIEPGDAFLFQPDQPHQIINNGTEDLVFYVIADNPIGESIYYPDSQKWLVRSPEKRLIRPESLEPLEYLEGEE